MADTSIAGHLTYVQYAWESAFGTAAATVNKAFGLDVSLSATPTTEIIKSRNLNSRDIQQFRAGKYEGTLTVSFTLASTKFLYSVLGQASSSGSGPYTHFYTPVNTVPSMTIEAGYDMGTTDVIRKFLGVKVNKCTISVSLNEVVKVTLDCIYQKEAPISSSLDATPAAETEDALTFSDGTLEFPNASAISRVQSADITFENGLISVQALGQRTVSNLIEGPRAYTGRVVHTFENSSAFLTTFGTGGELDTTEAASIELTLDNGKTSTSQRNLILLLNTVRLESDSIDTNPTDPVNEDVSFSAATVGTATAVDNTAGVWTAS